MSFKRLGLICCELFTSYIFTYKRHGTKYFLVFFLLVLEVNMLYNKTARVFRLTFSFMKNEWYSFPYREPICPFVTFKEMKFHKKSTIIEIVTLKIFFEQLRLKIFEKSEIQRGPGGVLCKKAPPLSSGF